jgi:Zn-dependent oligopeptidase
VFGPRLRQALFHRISREMMAPFPHAPRTHWFARFGHLTSYAAGYYNYLWCAFLARLLCILLESKTLLSKL